jgi:ferredoxin
MRIRVDPDVCEANGLCEQIAPEVFHLRDDDVLQILAPRPPADVQARAREAVERCPKAALSIVD